MAANDPRTAAGTRRIGLVQMRCEPDRTRNLSRAQDAIADAAQDGAEVVCLPELFRTPYLCQSEDPSRFDWAATERVWRDWPFLRDRRIDAYAGLGERFLDAPAQVDQTDSTSDSD